METTLTIKALEDCIRELCPDGIHLTRIYPDGKEHPDVPGLYYASDKFWKEFDIQLKSAIKNLTYHEG